ncbi:hypothetical protein A3F07_04155 [candidate division WWE3 bacterium RIFCSPHIGHO2_12_FULL_38_15]|uniref:Glycosyltransferase 2-like domain-containing protein n=1 Tax=candidate division WWE3 bacterium RIFCSPHIGHO2_02_FULL_38_14 TaxID=1802620 RepID=A0A1F4V805_UNCKA|nr:MAG: hypothetical protein A2793_01355 [candidate division WWE3 bacterium RIFCSPHIGHO2_01_FULL_38_45]OGC48488.1 MAG: hypothetical protein A3F07_04155 [candidate division WWE3 bacterium RIFCSPHIGHO2_12_FULL_38_15]OGC53351.1 MAG: hypothetical protein A3D91_02995 [candidate division WWE3 bacterium RIFCSPHIGHO2_02_FULL_38_14]OGC53837.1 MAG: hypothetical protein A3B64_00670 [candidate division WWE3 bacterium RIFCSPLOWO2_01_FULL_37_24]HLB51865.1 glycosyltransferase family 2 protein [Patescibacteria
MKKLSIIIVNYNTKDILRDCLKNLDKIYNDFEVIVVDNASKDDSAEMVKYEFKWVTLIENENNEGLAVANNLGFKYATGEYLLYLGSDAFPKKETIKGIIAFMDTNKEVGISTCKLVLRSGQIDLDAHRGFPTPWASITHFIGLNRIFPKSKLLNRYFLGYQNMEVPHEIDMCISHFMMVRREVFNTIGNWDEDFFLYGEDVDFCYRTKKAGWKIMYIPQFEAVHYKGATIGVRKTSSDISPAGAETKKLARENTVKAMKLFYSKHYKKVYPAIVTVLVLAGIKLMEKIRAGR